MNQQHSTPDWMLYGANGYTGEMIAREAARRGLRPVLAGRNRDKVESLARELGLEARVFDLDRPAEVARQVDGQTLVMHCAGPFSATAAPMMEACLGAGAHYLDISGEIAVFEHARSLDERARQAGITICPGVGFDVIPTDCVAAALKAALPDATHLALGFDSSSRFSPGTAKTLVEGMPQGGKVRRDGRIVTVPLAHGVRRIDFGNGEKNAMTIPWGDVSTAYATTGIPNIEVFIPASAGMVLGARLGNLVRPLLGLRRAGPAQGPHRQDRHRPGCASARRTGHLCLGRGAQCARRAQDGARAYRPCVQPHRQRRAGRGRPSDAHSPGRRRLHAVQAGRGRAGEQPARLGAAGDRMKRAFVSTDGSMPA